MADREAQPLTEPVCNSVAWQSLCSLDRRHGGPNKIARDRSAKWPEAPDRRWSARPFSAVPGASGRLAWPFSRAVLDSAHVPPVLSIRARAVPASRLGGVFGEPPTRLWRATAVSLSRWKLDSILACPDLPDDAELRGLAVVNKDVRVPHDINGDLFPALHKRWHAQLSTSSRSAFLQLARRSSCRPSKIETRSSTA
jgi:hypothetical protein